MKNILLKILYSNPVQGGIAAILAFVIIFGLIILVAWIHSLF